ncbi:DNA circularization N-terminal domain-containing protein [Pseudomonas asiatica]|uniref:DNA circularization protein n=1 Tax=Pseudomonas asiatica TaxID=2219225 RepID=UPI002E7BBA96|nr:DNA circularization N-terminal domain-containing protein [Pseudomonas asiatica]MEE1920283.1 DNA circularization N-terminal domain-containing protein [Pseudomonas asiatica]
MTDTTWRDSLLPASFRGVAFEVEQASMPTGQRGQLHEFVQRDDPFFEQLGKRSQPHRLTAFVIGPDCFERRDKLLEALEKPGAGELVHPWLGRMLVKAGQCEVSHERREGGMVRFELEMHPDQPRKYPSAKPNTQQQVAKASDGLLDAALGRYSAAMDKIDTGRINLNSLRNSVSGVFAALQQQFSPIAASVNGLAGFIQTIVNAPDSLNSIFSSYFSSLGGGSGSSSASYRSSLSAANQQVETALAIDTIAPAGGADTSASAQATANLIQDALLVQAGRIVSDMPVSPAAESVASVPPLAQQVQQPVERPEVPVADDVLQLRDDLSEAIWRASLKADHTHYEALTAIRHALNDHLTAVAASGVRLVDVTPEQTLPALVLAYRRFGDATRQGEVVQRNRIRHPGFVPPVSLKLAKE